MNRIAFWVPIVLVALCAADEEVLAAKRTQLAAIQEQIAAVKRLSLPLRKQMAKELSASRSCHVASRDAACVPQLGEASRRPAGTTETTVNRINTASTFSRVASPADDQGYGARCTSVIGSQLKKGGYNCRANQDRFIRNAWPAKIKWAKGHWDGEVACPDGIGWGGIFYPRNQYGAAGFCTLWESTLVSSGGSFCYREYDRSLKHKGPGKVSWEDTENMACNKGFIIHPDNHDPRVAMVGYKRTACVWKSRSASPTSNWYRECAVFKTGHCIKLKDWAGFGMGSHTTVAGGNTILHNAAISMELMEAGRREFGKKMSDLLKLHGNDMRKMAQAGYGCTAAEQGAGALLLQAF